MVTDQGGIDDKSFNASAWGALKRAETDLGIQKKYLESREITDYEGNLSWLAQQQNDLVFAVGFMMEEALGKVASKFPNTRFAIIDGSAPALPNCVALKFREEQGCFLAGYLAGRITKTGAIGFVGGIESPLIKKFEVGYIAGARTAKADIREELVRFRIHRHRTSLFGDNDFCTHRWTVADGRAGVQRHAGEEQRGCAASGVGWGFGKDVSTTGSCSRAALNVR